jgi:hypothetical protein
MALSEYINCIQQCHLAQIRVFWPIFLIFTHFSNLHRISITGFSGSPFLDFSRILNFSRIYVAFFTDFSNIFFGFSKHFFPDFFPDFCTLCS